MDIVISKKNEGFARGNNLGIKKAVNDYCSDLIIVSNNDIEIPDTEFMQKVIQVYKRTYFDVMGPIYIQQGGTFIKVLSEVHT